MGNFGFLCRAVESVEPVEVLLWISLLRFPIGDIGYPETLFISGTVIVTSTKYTDVSRMSSLLK